MSESTNKVKKFIDDHATEIVCSAIAVGGWLIFCSGYKWGYRVRINYEKLCDFETGSKIMEALDKFETIAF